MKRKIRTARAYAMALALTATISMTSCRTQDYSTEPALNNRLEQIQTKTTRSGVSTISEDTVFAKIQLIISDLTDIPIGQIQLNSELQKDLGLDSLDVFQTIMSIEEEFNTEVPSEACNDFITVKDLVDYILSPQQPVPDPNAEIFTKLQEIIREQTNVADEQVIDLQSNLRTDLGIDSLDLFQVIMSIEEEFDIEISGDCADNFITVEDIVLCIAEQSEQRPPVNPPVDPPIVDPNPPVDPPVNPPVDPPITDPDPPVVNPADAEGRLKKILSDRTGTPVSMLTRGTNLRDDLEMDELDIIEFKIHVEAEFGILISDDRVQRLITIGDWITYIENRS